MRFWIGKQLARLACWIAGEDCPCDFCIIWQENWCDHRSGAKEEYHATTGQ